MHAASQPARAPTVIGGTRLTPSSAVWRATLPHWHTTQRASAVVEMPIVHSGADHPPQASRTQGHDQPVYFPSGPLQRVPGAAAAAVAPTSTSAGVAAAAAVATTTTRTGPRPTTLALSPNSQEVKRKKRERQQVWREKRKREEVAVAQAQAAEKAARHAASQKKFRLKKKK